jgi:hypothetical protein
MTRFDADRVAMFTAQMYLQYGHDLLAITGVSCARHDLPNAGPFACTLNEVQDGSFRLGILAGLRAQLDPVVLRFLEGQAAMFEPPVQIPGPAGMEPEFTIDITPIKDTNGQ